MAAAQSPDRHLLVSRRKTRLIALKVLISSLHAGAVQKGELLDEDDSFAQLIGARRHRQFVEQAEALEDEEETGMARIIRRCRFDRELNELAVEQLRICQARLLERPASSTDHVTRNIQSLAGYLGLDDIEMRLIDFAVRMEADEAVFKACETFSGQGRHGQIMFHRLLARILDCSRRDIEHALSPQSQLSATGIFRDGDYIHNLRSPHGTLKTDFGDLTLMPGVAQTVMSKGLDFDHIFAPFFQPLSAPTVALSSFDFMGDTVGVLRALLAGAMHTRARGVQILLHGAPGTGKSELAHALAHTIGARAYGIASESAQGVPYDRDARFRCLKIARYALRSRADSLLVFDEVEDVFPSRFGAASDSRRQKGWLNGMLESSPVPGIWITNSLSEIDPAYLRRFNMVIEMRRPPRATRLHMAERYLGEFELEPAFLQRVSEKASVTPADLARTGRTLNLVGATTEPSATAATILAAGATGISAHEFQSPALFRLADFDPALINTDLDADRLIAQLERSGEGRLCFYGPPGTGKTALARHIATAVDRELITIAASSWMSPFVGETEHRIRASFDQADASRSVLFVDEADTFLRDRALASRSWETSRVNELLKCLEESRGIVIFATNAFDALDPAVLRRLDIKTQFRPLTPDQCVALLASTLVANDIPLTEQDWAARERVRGVAGVVGGDFAAACRRIQVSGAALSALSLAEAVSDEVRLRNRHQNGEMGFL